MLKALLKKQFKELGLFYFQSKKGGQKRSKAAVTGMIILFIFLGICMMAAFFGMGELFAVSFLGNGYDWLYFAMVGLISVLFGIVGEIFMTYSMLYRAKDNELLLSMPIPPAKILFARMASIYLTGLIFVCIVMVPMILCYWIHADMTLLSVILPVLMILVVGFIVLALTCVLGFVVALIGSRVHNKSVITVLISLLLMGVYYVCYFRMNSILTSLAAHADEIRNVLGARFNPFYLIGSGCTGNLLDFFLTAVLAAALFGLVYWILSRSFIRLITTKTGEKKVAFKGAEAKKGSAEQALLKRELKHFVSSPAYMLNTGLGLIILIALAVLALVKKAELTGLQEALKAAGPVVAGAVPIILAAVIMLILSMNAFTAPSVSLEGKCLWIVRTMPVSAQKILNAKLRMHVLLNEGPLMIAVVGIGSAAGLEPLAILCAALAASVFNAFCAVFGLMLNLLKPNFDWTNETIPVKQGVSVIIHMFGGWLIAAGLNGLYFLTGKFIGAEVHLLLETAVLAAASILLYRWINTKGTALFDTF